MRITRLYHPDHLNCGEVTHLDVNASSHLIRVLRTKIDTDLILFNGDGFDYHCKTLDTNQKKTAVKIETKNRVCNESDLSITLIQGLSRQDRMDATIQKSIELGVNKIIPVTCQRSNNRLSKEKEVKKLAHWRKVAISACEQSGRSVIPQISDVTQLKDITHSLESRALRLNLNPQATTSPGEIEYRQQTIELFIGPEGGLNKTEIEFLKDNDFEDIRFGPRILRTETAGPAVICALQVLWGDI